MWPIKGFVIIMNSFESRIVKHLSNTLIWRTLLVEFCWKGAHSFNSVVEVFACNSNWISELLIWSVSICNCYFDRSCNSAIFSPHKIKLAFWQPWLQTGYLLNILLPLSVVWNIWSFLGKKRQNIFFGFFSLIERASFCQKIVVWLELCVGLFSTQYSILNTENQPKRHP